MRLTRALIARTGGSPLPAPQSIASIIPSLSCWGSGRDVKDCRPHRRIETKVAKALPRAVSSSGRGQGDSAIEGTEQAFSSPGCPSLDDRKGVTPGSPVRSGTICTCRTQAESTTPPGKPRRPKTVFGQLLGIELEELCKAMCNGIIVVTREPFREVGREGPEEEVSAGHRAEMKQQPGCLQAVKPWDTAEQRVMLGALEAESLADVGFVAERRAQYQEPLLRGREGPVANPDGLRDVAGQVSDGRGLLTCRVPDACFASMKLDAGVLPQGSAPRIQYRGRTRSGLATM